MFFGGVKWRATKRRRMTDKQMTRENEIIAKRNPRTGVLSSLPHQRRPDESYHIYVHCSAWTFLFLMRIFRFSCSGLGRGTSVASCVKTPNTNDVYSTLARPVSLLIVFSIMFFYFKNPFCARFSPLLRICTVYGFSSATNVLYLPQLQVARAARGRKVTVDSARD